MTASASVRLDGESDAPDMMSMPLAVRTDPRHGGRWTSLTAGGREWLWHHPDPAVARARGDVVPGQVFVDAGGVEECLPTIDGLPDHGAVWCVPWESRPAGDMARAGALTIARSLTVREGTIRAAYAITGPPGAPFVHAVHTLLDVGPQARLAIPEPQTARIVGGDGEPAGEQPWPPLVAGSPAGDLGDVDGTAVAILLPGCRRVTVVDGDDALELRWEVSVTSGKAAGEDPRSLLVWRNLGGWPAGAPYRSIGIEPMVGRTTTVAGRSRPGDPPAAAPGAVRMPDTGRFDWVLRIRAWRHTGPTIVARGHHQH